jgi:hypothetical protein
VHVKGRVRASVGHDSGTAQPCTPPEVFTLPTGYRPGVKQVFAVTGETAQPKELLGAIEIRPDGTVVVRSFVEDGYWFSLDGIAFRADA